MRDAAAATRALVALLQEWEATTGVECIPVGEPVEYGPYWVQGYQSKAFVLDGDFSSALAGNGPVVIPKDGSDLFSLNSSEPAGTQMERLLEAREM